jgi:hypothetical protein
MNNWLVHNLKQRTKDNKLPFAVKFNFQPFSPSSFKEESEKVCIDLYTKYGNNLFLAFSGGSDSEYIINTFLALNLPIKPVIVSCPYNQLDIQAAFLYCKKHNIEPIVLTYGYEYLEIAKEKIYSKGLMSPIGLTPLLVYDNVKHLGGKVISGQGEPLPITNRGNVTKIDTIIQMYEFEFYMDTYANEEQPAPFYCYNQNIFYSYMNEIDKSMYLEAAKCNLYKIDYRPKTYWSQEIYADIRENKPLTDGFSCEYSAELLLSNMKKFIIQ